MTIGDTKPPEIDVKIRVLCPNGTGWQTSLTCDGIKLGSEVNNFAQHRDGRLVEDKIIASESVLSVCLTA